MSEQQWTYIPPGVIDADTIEDEDGRLTEAGAQALNEHGVKLGPCPPTGMAEGKME